MVYITIIVVPAASPRIKPSVWKEAPVQADLGVKSQET